MVIDGTISNVRFGSKADICAATGHVRFASNSDRKSGHRTSAAVSLCGRHVGKRLMMRPAVRNRASPMQGADRLGRTTYGLRVLLKWPGGRSEFPYAYA